MLTEYMESKGHNKQRAKILRDKIKMDDGVRHAIHSIYSFVHRGWLVNRQRTATMVTNQYYVNYVPMANRI